MANAEPNKPAVERGRNGQLFLVGGNHNVLEYFTGARRATAEAVEHFYDNLRARNEDCAAAGRPYAHIVFPDPMVTLATLHDHDVQSVYLRDYFRDAPTEDALRVAYPIGALEGRRELQDTDDLHYAPGGVLAMARVILERLGAGLPALPEVKTFTEVSSELGLLGHVDPTVTSRQINGIRFAPGATTGHNNIRQGNNGIIDLIASPGALTRLKLLIFGDSFLRQTLGPLSYVFGEILFLRTPHYHAEMVAAVAPDMIVTGNAERYLASCAPDTARPHFLAMPLQSGVATQPSSNFAELWQKMVNSNQLARDLKG